MPFTKNEFDRWFIAPLLSLQSQQAGFPQLMIALPLLERYLRETSGTGEAPGLNSKAYEVLLSLFPQLEDTVGARSFWSVFRNGLLHQVAMSQATAKGTELPVGVLSFEVSCVIKHGRAFYINPTDFANKVIRTIQDDFDTFVGTGSPNHPLPEERFTFGRSSTANVSHPPGESEVIGNSGMSNKPRTSSDPNLREDGG